MSSALPVRGTVEGFYGVPWTHAERLAHLDFSASVGLTSFVYAPKDDPYHRFQWRDPYPEAELGRLAELADRARRLGIRFTYALHPATSMRYTDDAEHATLARKTAQLFDAGITSFALFFDDVPYELEHPGDREHYGAGQAGSGAAHGETCSRFVRDVLMPRGIDEPLLICPTDYAGVEPSDYRDQLARTAPADAIVAWTGHDVVVGTVTREDVDRAAAAFRRRLVLWDNFPVNDFDPSHLYLGPLTGRTSDLDGSALVGIISNPSPQAEASRFALTTVAEWASDPAEYDPVAAMGRAVERVAGAGADQLRPLVQACSGWPPSAPEDAELFALLSAARIGDAGARVAAEQRLAGLRDASRAARVPASLVASVRAWLDGAVDLASAGLAALRLLGADRSDGEAVARLRADTRVALEVAESHYFTVLRGTVPPFVRDVLDDTAPASLPRAQDPRPVARLVTGRPTDAVHRAADRAAAELLESLGYAVSPVDSGSAATDAGRALVVITESASEESAAQLKDAPVPVVTWRGATALGMARSQEPVMIQNVVTVSNPAHPLALGHDGDVALYRGWAWMIVGDVDDEHVILRAGLDKLAALYAYAAGDTLADGSTAPAARVGLPLGKNGPARWVLTPEGREIVTAAVRFAVGGFR